ncbi:MAG: PD-(D/E)XK nuclease family protein, partial [Myxococcota bacterium]
PSLPAGAATGLLVHEVLEGADFRSRGGAPELAEQILRRHGQPEAWRDELVDVVEATARVPLTLGRGLSASLVQSGGGVPELEFTLPLKPSSQWQRELRDALVAEGGIFERYAAELPKLAIDRVAGFVRGFIDWAGEIESRAVVIDYKSNLLSDYGEAALEQAMIDHHYVLQALVYSVAARRFIVSRGVELLFGGAHYLFLRGLDPSGRGVASLHPSDTLLAAFEGALLGAGA